MSSACVVGTVVIQEGLQFGRLPFDLARTILDLTGCLLGHLIRQRLPGSQCLDSGLGRAFGIVHAAGGIGDAFPDDHHAVVASAQHLLRGARHPQAVRRIRCNSTTKSVMGASP